MQSEQLYAQILGITSPWRDTRVDLDMAQQRVEVHVELDPDQPARCPP